MACQSSARGGAAPASVSAADMSALLPEVVGQGSLVTDDQGEVGSLSGGRRCPPYPPRYRAALAFSPLLCPPAYRRPSRAAFPPRGGRRVYHVPHPHPRGLGRVSWPVARRRRARNAEPRPLATHLLVPAC